MDFSSLKNTLSQLSALYIIYNTGNNKIEWCNKYENENLYAGASAYHAFFTTILNNEVSGFDSDWGRCLGLKNNESYSFICSVKNQASCHTFSVHAEGISLREPMQSFILISCDVLEKNPLRDQLIFLQKQLQEAKQTLERAEAQKNDFILLASHDLQAPVRKWNAYMEKWRMKNENISDEQTLFYADRMSFLSKHLYSLVDDLNLLMELKSDTPLEYCDLNKIIQIVLSEMNAIIPAKASVILRDVLPAINGNVTQLKNLFTQLIYNSIIFKKENGPLQVLITASHPSDEEKKEFLLDNNIAYCKIIIEDNGVGFDQEFSNQIFRPFYKLQGGSNGMGLAICKQIVQNHKGFLYAIGETDIGARFIVILPSL